MSKNGWFTMLLLAFALAGCATPNTIRLTDGKGKTQTVVREVGIDPVMLTGLPWSEDLKQGNFLTLLGNFPQTPENWAEWDPLRIRYQAHAVGRDGREYTAHALFAGYIECAPRLFVFVEGLKNPDADVKVIILSTLLDRAYTLEGKQVEKFEAGPFQSDALYRKEMILRDGTALDTSRHIGGMEEAFANWSVYNTKSGQIATPLESEKIKFLAGINPQYSYWEKVVGTSGGAISIDYISTTVGIVFDLISAGSAKSQGFDYNSSISRQQQGYNVAFLEALRDEGSRNCITSRIIATRGE